MKVIKWLDKHLEETILALLLIVIACVMLAQVVIRKIPGIPALTWAEEFCRFCWIWSVFLSLPYTIRGGSMLRVTAILDILPEVLRKILNLIVDVVVVLSMALLFYHSIGVVSGIMASGETSPAMLWPMWIIYSIMVVGFCLAVVRGVQMFIIHIRTFKQHDHLTTADLAMAEAELEAEMVKEVED